MLGPMSKTKVGLGPCPYYMLRTPSGSKVKISSFTRRLNRWGFLQCRVPGLENELVSENPSLTTYGFVVFDASLYYLTSFHIPRLILSPMIEQ